MTVTECDCEDCAETNQLGRGGRGRRGSGKSRIKEGIGNPAIEPGIFVDEVDKSLL